MKFFCNSFLLVLSVLWISGCERSVELSDLRLNTYEFPNNPDKAKRLLKEMGIAHQIHLWDSIETYQVIFEDEFYGNLGEQSNPFKEQKIDIFLTLHSKNYLLVNLKLLVARTKEISGEFNLGKRIAKNRDGEIEIKKNSDMKFWISDIPIFH